MANQEVICAHCGAPLREGMKFCTGCGGRVEAATPPLRQARTVTVAGEWLSADDARPVAPNRPEADVRSAGDWSPPARSAPPPPPPPPPPSPARPWGVDPPAGTRPIRTGGASDAGLTRMIPRVALPRLYGWIVVMNGAEANKDH